MVPLVTDGFYGKTYMWNTEFGPAMMIFTKSTKKNTTPALICGMNSDWATASTSL